MILKQYLKLRNDVKNEATAMIYNLRPIVNHPTDSTKWPKANQYKHIPYTNLYHLPWNFTLNPKMNRDVITDLVFANLLDLIPLIRNTDEENDLAILRVYDRTAAILEDI